MWGWQRCGSSPTSRLLQARREGRRYRAAWTRPKTGCVGKKQRSLIWSLSLKRVNTRTGAHPYPGSSSLESCPSLVDGNHTQALAIGGRESCLWDMEPGFSSQSKRTGHSLRSPHCDASVDVGGTFYLEEATSIPLTIGFLG